MSSARLLILSEILASAVGAKATLIEIFALKRKAGTHYDAFELSFDSANVKYLRKTTLKIF